jgi:hypothetical protein
MERLFRFLLIVVILVALASCGVFFSPIEGRWNLDDPKNELLTFRPIIDGYAHNTDPFWVESDYLLAYPGSKIILLRFDTAGFPDVVAASYLQLTVATQPPTEGTVLSIYRIINAWDTATMTYAIANDPAKFYDRSAVATFTVPTSLYTGDHIQIPVSEVFSGDKDELANGIIIYSSENVTFDSTETGTAPLLLVQPE